MARAKLRGELTSRFHMAITKDELAAIDDFRFAERIGTRSAAVRRLLELALENWRASRPPLVAEKDVHDAGY